MQPVSRLHEFASHRTDGKAAALARIILGTAALLQAFDSAHILSLVLDESRLHIPTSNWIPVISADLVPLYITFWIVAATAFVIGWYTRIAGLTLTALIAYSLFVDAQTYSNHVYLLTLLIPLLVLADCGSRYSIDARLGRGQPSTPRWPLELVKIQLSLVYFFAAVSKVNVVYVSGAIISANVTRGWLLPLPDFLARWEVLMPVAMASILAELFLAIAFWSDRYRRAAIVVGIALHAAIFLTFPPGGRLPLAVFGIIMFGMYVPFLNAGTLVEQARAILIQPRAFIASHLPRLARHDSAPPG